MLLHVYQFTEIILLPLSQKGNGVADHRAFYPVTGKGNRYCGKVFSAITKRHYTRRLVQRISLCRTNTNNLKPPYHWHELGSGLALVPGMYTAPTVDAPSFTA
jgi:hypothetical protein